MEINARIGGALDSVTSAGIDFPVLLWQWATGRRVQRTASYRAGVRTRWLQGDIRWLGANLIRIGRPDSEPLSRAPLMFIGEFARTRRYDCRPVPQGTDVYGTTPTGPKTPFLLRGLPRPTLW